MAFIIDLSQSNSDHNGKLESFSVDAAHATLLAPGDVIRITGTADAEGRSGADAAAASQSITGVIAGVEPQYVGENLTETGLPALTAGVIRCQIDPEVNYIADVTNGTLAVTNVGQNINLVATAATKTGGLTRSNMSVDAATAATTASLPFRIVGLVQNESGVVDGTKARVRINNSTAKAGATGV
jgi:hypothetical protein